MEICLKHVTFSVHINQLMEKVQIPNSLFFASVNEFSPAYHTQSVLFFKEITQIVC